MKEQQGYLATLVATPLYQILPRQQKEHLPDLLTSLAADPPAILPHNQADKVLQALVDCHGNDDCCVLPPMRFDYHASGPLHHLFLCSNTLREALYYLEKYSPLLSEQMVVNVTRSRTGPLRVRIDLKEKVRTALHRHRVELLVSTLLSWLRQLCGSRLHVEQILLPWEAPGYRSRYDQQWQAKILFDQPQCVLELHADSLDLGLHDTNPNITQLMRREVELQFRKLVRAGSLCDHISKALLNGQLELSATQQVIAAHFNISTRTLNRHLQRENTSLKQLITRVRVSRARHLLLHTQSSIDDIAVQLGLSGRRALDRIFHKALDISPAQYRQRGGLAAENLDDDVPDYQASPSSRAL